jgi:hypothetical protein
MEKKQKWIGNPRQDFWTRFHDAVEEKTGQRFRTDIIPSKCDFPNSLKILTKTKYVAYLVPPELFEGRSRVELNKQEATYWLEVEEGEPFYEKILEDLGIKLSDFWDGDPYW